MPKRRICFVGARDFQEDSEPVQNLQNLRGSLRNSKHPSWWKALPEGRKTVSGQGQRLSLGGLHVLIPRKKQGSKVSSYSLKFSGVGTDGGGVGYSTYFLMSRPEARPEGISDRCCPELG